MSSDSGYPPGTAITGKWRNSRYIVERMLGKGANGRVYLVQRPGHSGKYALKIGYDALELQSEINVLSSLEKKLPEPYLVEADDHRNGSTDVPFYVMRYVEGMQLHRFISTRGRDWLGLVGLKLLERLVHMHESGYIFGDLKPENVMVAPYGRVELIDYGGVSPIGRSVKQFTEWYDRGYWNAGSRTGDEAYDLFSFAVMCIHLLDEESLRTASVQLPQIRSTADLQEVLRKSRQLAPFAPWLDKALSGGFADSREALDVWKRHVYTRHWARKRDKTPSWLKHSFVLSLCAAGTVLIWYVTS